MISPPEPSDDKLKGSFYVWALIDEENADDTGEGKILFRIPVRTGGEDCEIDSKTGKQKC